MTKNPMTAALMALAMLAPTAALADLWNDTPMRDADIYFNEIVRAEKLSISKTAFSRLGCRVASDDESKKICTMAVLPVAQVTFRGASLDAPPEKMDVMFVTEENTDIDATLQSYAVLILGSAPSSTEQDQKEVFDMIFSVAKTKETASVIIEGVDFSLSPLPPVGMYLSIRPSELLND